jgi:hypothetical protein
LHFRRPGQEQLHFLGFDRRQNQSQQVAHDYRWCRKVVYHQLSAKNGHQVDHAWGGNCQARRPRRSQLPRRRRISSQPQHVLHC